MSTRRSFIALAVAATAACQHRSAAVPPTVLFVCQFGTVKSAVAREMTRRRASELGLAVNVISRGITPQDHISPALAQRLEADGIDPAPQSVQALDAATLQHAQIVVLLDPLPAGMTRADARDWTSTPSLNNSYDAAKSFLVEHINGLLEPLQR